ncbi:LOW QUALITY PROTEIN: X-linked retinitis pigmentosa GTPase regulator [Glossina fuscipes]|uniref:LOW QUALITY PROTEIN: X-linked retinitis pigmentosa GTPase regulator n=1 Tax=Glossina fuscipes TaxID=7396 RepID=A0A9C5ZKG2_9MUSC|nr:LOW QUALITY PROTEIN: X-linked retinitis pigmentosa GTPase regulator [Glossina fuscipes]
MDVPNTGAIFTLGKSHLAENTQSYFYIKNDPIKRLIAGPHQSAVICESGRLFVWGENHYGQLGIGSHSAANVNRNSSHITNNNSGDVIIKPTCVKSLKLLGLKIADLAFGTDWSAILTYSNEIFFTGRNIFTKPSAVSSNSSSLKGLRIISQRSPLTVASVKFDDCLSNNEETENFINILAGNEHFMVLTSYGRLIGWGSNKSYQLGLSNRESILKPQEIILESPVQKFTCGPESTMVLTQNGNLYLTGHLNDFVFPQFTELQKNLSSNEQIIYMHISKCSDVFIVTNAGSIYRSFESVRAKSLIFQRFYDYDSEENGPIWKILKGTSFYAVLTKANKFYTTFSESGHHLKTFREISKFKNLRLVDMTLGDRHILVHGIPRSSTMFATISSDYQQKYMAQNFAAPITATNLMTANSVANEITNNREESINEISKQADKRKAISKPSTPANNHILTDIKENNNNNFNYEDIENIYSAKNGNYQEEYSHAHSKYSPTGSVESCKSVCSTKTLKKITSAERLLRPRTPYPDSNASDSPQSIIRKTPLRTLSYEAAMNEDCLEHTSPALVESLENIKEATATNAVQSSAPNVNISMATPPTEDDDKLTVEISESTDPLDHAMVVNEIRFINNGIDVTSKVKKQVYLVEFENKPTNDESKDDTENFEIRKQAEILINDLENKIEQRFEEGKELKKEIGTVTKETAEHVDLEAVEDKVKTDLKAEEAKLSLEAMANRAASEVRSGIDKVTETSKKKAEEALQSVEDMGNSAAKVTEEGFQALEQVGRNAVKATSEAKDAMGSALKKAADGTRQAVGSVTSKISTEVQDAKNTLSSLLLGKRNKVDIERPQKDFQFEEEEKVKTELQVAVTENQNKSNNSQLTTNSINGHEDDERTTASANSTHPSANNPFETNPFDNEVEDASVKDKTTLREEVNTISPTAEAHSEQIIDQENKQKSKLSQFFHDIKERSRNISCRNEKSTRIEDDQPPRYTEEDELALQPINGQRAGSSKVCTIL